MYYFHFYPTAHKACQGIVFIHGVLMGGRWEKVCLGCISETVRCRKLILGRDIGWGVGVQHHGVALIRPCGSDLEFENLVRAMARKP